MARPLGHRMNRAAWDFFLRERGLSLTQVAEESDTPRPSLSAIVGGHNRASVPIAHRLAAVLRCEPGVLFPDLDSKWSYDDEAERAEKSAAKKRKANATRRAA
jgi:plasmid maintenance system antidote protein VapI